MKDYKHLKISLIKTPTSYFLVFLLIFTWFFSSWPRIWQNPPIPPEIEKTLAHNSPVAANRSLEYNLTPILTDVTNEYSPSPNVVFIDSATGYVFAVTGAANIDNDYNLSYMKTNDGGTSWGSPVQLNPSRAWANVVVWYDQWTPGNTTGTKIHVAAAERGTYDVWYNYLDTSMDTLRTGGWIRVLDSELWDVQADGGPGITKSTDGYLFVSGFGTFGGSLTCKIYKSIDNGDSWIDTSVSAISGLDDSDFGQLLPLSNGDILFIMQDITVNKVISLEYDEADDAWEHEMTIDSSWVENAGYDSPWGASVNKSTNHVYLAGMNEINSVTGDLEAYKLTDQLDPDSTPRSWSILTEIISNDQYVLQGTMAINPSDNKIYAVYIRCPSGVGASCKANYKVSADDGSTWSSPIEISDTLDDLRNIRTSFSAANRLYAVWYNDDTNQLKGATIQTSGTVVADVTIDGTIFDATDQYNPSPNTVFTSSSTGYSFYIDSTSDVVYRKTTDGGNFWSERTVLSPDYTWHDVAVWYDQWTPGDTSGTKIHIAAVEEVTNDIWYHSLDTSDDSLDGDGWRVVVTGNTYTSETSGNPSIVKSTDGNLFIIGFTDTFGKVFKSSDGDSWADTSITADIDDEDIGQLLPLAEGDVLLILQDVSIDTLQSKVYDEATDTWDSSWTSIDASWVDTAAYDVTWGATVNKSSGNIYLAGTNAVASATGDIKAFKYSGSWSTLTEIISNNANILGATMGVESSSGDLYALYLRGGVNAIEMNLYLKTSNDDGSTWSSETKLNVFGDDLRYVRSSLTKDNRLYVTWYNDDFNNLLGNQVTAAVNQSPAVDLTETLNDATDQYSNSPNVVFTDSNTGYIFLINPTQNVDGFNKIAYEKTTDGGASWKRRVVIPSTETVWHSVSVWYDQWTPGDTSGTKIHITAVESTTDDIWYHSLDTSDDTLDSSGWVPVVMTTAAYTQEASGAPSITKSASNNYLFILGYTSNFGAIYKSIDGGDNWANTSIAAGIDDQDNGQLLPLSNGDILLINQDISTNSLQSKVYDEASDTWSGSWTTIDTIVESATYDSTWNASINKTSSDVYLAGNNYVANAAGDIKTYKYTDSGRSWSTLTDVETDNALLAQATMAVDSSTGYLYAIYLMASSGLTTDTTINYKVSVDDGSTWSNPIEISDVVDDIKYLYNSFSTANRLYVSWVNDDLNYLVGNSIDTSSTVVGTKIIDGSTADATFQFNSGSNSVFVSATTGYIFYVDASTDVVFRKTTDGGIYWSQPVAVDDDKTWNNVAIWYDQWTPGDTSGTKIHIVAAENVTDDLWYNYLETSGGADTDRGGWSTIALGSRYDADSDGGPGVTKSTDGYLFASGFGTYVTDIGIVYKSVDSGDTWANTSFSAASGLDDNDNGQLLPLSNGDILFIMQDITQDKLISLEYDEADDVWEHEMTIDSSWVENASLDASWGAVVYKTTNNVYLAGTNAVNNTSGDIEAFKLTDSADPDVTPRAWSTLTEIISNHENILQATLAINTSNGELYAVYAKGNAAFYKMDVYTKISDDDGSTWGEETKLNVHSGDIRYIQTNFMNTSTLYVSWYKDNFNNINGRVLDSLGPLVSVVITTDGVIEYGAIGQNSTKSTLPGELDDMQTVENSGTVTENFNIKGQNATGGGCTWTLASSNDSDQYVHQFCNDTDNDCSSPPTDYIALTTEYQALDTGIAVDGTVDFQLRLTTPNPSSCFGQQSVDVTIQAVQQ